MAVLTGLGDMLSSVGVGWLWAAMGPRITFGTALVPMLAGILLMLYLARKIASRNPNSPWQKSRKPRF